MYDVIVIGAGPTGSTASKTLASNGYKVLLVETVVPKGELLRDEIGSIIIISDITNEKELSRQKEEFFANASHELKTPLTTMLGLTELALAKCEEETEKKHLEKIYKESLRLSRRKRSVFCYTHKRYGYWNIGRKHSTFM